MSEETKRKLSEAIKKSYRQGKRKRYVWTSQRREVMAQKICQAHKRGAFDGREERISEGVKKAWKEGAYENRNTPEYRKNQSEKRKQAYARGMYQGVHKNPSQLAIRIFEAIDHLGYKPQLEYQMEGHSFDIFVPSLNLLCEVDGEYWHHSDRAKAQGVPERDRLKQQIAISNDFQFGRIRERDVNSLGADKAVSMMLDALVEAAGGWDG